MAKPTDTQQYLWVYSAYLQGLPYSVDRYVLIEESPSNWFVWRRGKRHAIRKSNHMGFTDLDKLREHLQRRKDRLRDDTVRRAATLSKEFTVDVQFVSHGEKIAAQEYGTAVDHVVLAPSP